MKNDLILERRRYFNTLNLQYDNGLCKLPKLCKDCKI